MKRALPFIILLSLLLSLFSSSVSPTSANAEIPTKDLTVKIFGANSQTLVNAGVTPSTMIDYGSFLWVTLPPDQLGNLEKTDLTWQPVEDAYTLDLGNQQFDPLSQPLIFESGWAPYQNNSAPDLQLIQFVGPIKSDWLKALQVDALEIVQYIHPFTYIVWGTTANLSRASLASQVRWAGSFAAAFRVLPQYRALPEANLPVQALLYRGADTDKLIENIERLGGTLVDHAPIDPVLEVALFNLPGNIFSDVAQLPGVYSIQPLATNGGLRGELSSQINVGNYDASNLAFTGYQDWLSSLSLSGEGVIIADVDSGVDNDHPDLINNMLTCSGSSCGGSGQSNHGTHTAGIMAADGASGILDSSGFLRGLGVAPGANLIEQLYSPTYTFAGGLLTLMAQSWSNGAIVSGNSWGPSGTPLGYDANTRQVDVGVRDVDPIEPGDQSLNYILSFMNGGGGTSTQGTPDEAKNIFTIGSTELQFSSGAQQTSINDVSYNSAHGPALDGRIIPHMVAPGCYVDSTNINSYQTMCGTSMSSPQVSGAVALFIEYYRYLFSIDPSPALVKAAFLPVAHDLAGFHDADNDLLGHPFDSKQGWGRLNLSAVLDPQGDVQYYDAPQVFDNSGETWQVTLDIPDPSMALQVMLAWTDAPGHGLGGTTPAWNNDLDLVVSAGGNTYLGNNFNTTTGWSQVGGIADYKNNTEGVFLPASLGDQITITVNAANIASDGLPNSGDITDQDFSLVIYIGPYKYIFPLAFSMIK